MQFLVCVIRMGSLQDVGGNSQESDLQDDEAAKAAATPNS